MLPLTDVLQAYSNTAPRHRMPLALQTARGQLKFNRKLRSAGQPQPPVTTLGSRAGRVSAPHHAKPALPRQLGSYDGAGNRGLQARRKAAPFHVFQHDAGRGLAEAQNADDVGVPAQERGMASARQPRAGPAGKGTNPQRQ